VRAARRYERWSTQDPSPVGEAYKDLKNKGVKNTLLQWAKNSYEKDEHGKRVVGGKDGGWIIHRHVFPGFDFPKIFPEIRPDWPVVTRYTFHWHGGGNAPGPEDRFEMPNPRARTNPKAKKTINVKANVLDPESKTAKRHLKRKKIATDHGIGAPADGVHMHEHPAKYLFPSGGQIPEPFTHDHAKQFSYRPSALQIALFVAMWYRPWLWTVKEDAGELTKTLTANRLLEAMGMSLANTIRQRDKHFAKYHDPTLTTTPPDVEGEHTHGEMWHAHNDYGEDPTVLFGEHIMLARHRKLWHGGKHRKRAGQIHRHVRTVKNTKDKLAARVDVNPLALERFDKASIVYFGIEGCFKADSILSAVIRDNRNAAVLSVPAVSLWRTPETQNEGFLDKLRSKVVVIVPDADWHTKGQVKLQAFLLQTCLERHSIMALVAAPPQDSGEKGIDDYLGKIPDASLDKLEVIEKRKPPALEEYLETMDKAALRRAGLMQYLVKTDAKKLPRKDKIKRAAKHLAELIAFAADRDDPEPHGLKRGELKMTVNMLAPVLDESPSTASEALKDLQATGAITTDRPLIVSKGLWSGELEWDETPIITLHDDLKPSPTEPQLLADKLRGIMRERYKDTA